MLYNGLSEEQISFKDTIMILTAVSGVGSSPALATSCETSQVLLADESCGFSRGSLVFI